MKAQLEPGDAVIAAASAESGRLQPRARPRRTGSRRTGPRHCSTYSRRHDQAVDTQYGIPTILNANDLEAALSAHRRVWLIGPDSVIRSLIPAMRTIVEKQFTLQEDGEFVSVFLATTR